MIECILLQSLFFVLGMLMMKFAQLTWKVYKYEYVLWKFSRNPKETVRKLIESYKDANATAYYQTVGLARRLCVDACQPWAAPISKAVIELWSANDEAQQEFLRGCQTTLGASDD